MAPSRKAFELLFTHNIEHLFSNLCVGAGFPPAPTFWNFSQG